MLHLKKDRRPKLREAEFHTSWFLHQQFGAHHKAWWPCLLRSAWWWYAHIARFPYCLIQQTRWPTMTIFVHSHQVWPCHFPPSEYDSTITIVVGTTWCIGPLHLGGGYMAQTCISSVGRHFEGRGSRPPPGARWGCQRTQRLVSHYIISISSSNLHWPSLCRYLLYQNLLRSQKPRSCPLGETWHGARVLRSPLLQGGNMMNQSPFSQEIKDAPMSEWLILLKFK